MRRVRPTWLCLALLFFLGSKSGLATEACDAQSPKGDLCLCELSDLHPTQTSVGMVEVRMKAEKLKDELERRGERNFLKYLLKHDKEEPVIIGPGGVFYITDHHHLARALYDLNQSHTYCIIVDNRSEERVDDFWKSMEEKNEVYLKDQNGREITPSELPTSIKDLSNDPFRSLAGTVRESCGFEKDATASSNEDYLEFEWADYLRTHWSQTGIAADDIDSNFDTATGAALHLAAQKDAMSLPGYTGKTSCD